MIFLKVEEKVQNITEKIKIKILRKFFEEQKFTDCQKIKRKILKTDMYLTLILFKRFFYSRPQRQAAKSHINLKVVSSSKTHKSVIGINSKVYLSFCFKGQSNL